MENWFGIANGQISSVFELSSRDMFAFPFSDNKLSNYQWIFTKLAMCINIVEVCFGIANRQILSIFDRVTCPRYDSGRVSLFHIFISYNYSPALKK